jgi:excinuclease ABC subunit C
MAGRTDAMIKRLEREMRAASQELEFEKAARLRDDLAAVRRAMEKQAVVLGDGTDADVVAFADDPLEAAVQVFSVRGGRVRGQRGWVVEKTEELSCADLVHHFCSQVYGGAQGEADIPRELLVPELPGDVDALAEWLSGLRGSRVTIRVPQRGDKRALAETVRRNAEQALTQHKLRRAGDLTTRSKALDEIAEALGLDSAPLRIECYDVSQIQGTDVVASMVVFEDGLARKSEYRRFAITGATDDVSAISEVLRRRFVRYRAEAAPPSVEPGQSTWDAAQAGQEERPRKFAYPPQLVVVDGGAPQVNAAARVLTDLGITDVAVAGLAKRLEEVWLPHEEFPVILPRASESLYLLQRVRDEAHRFAITYHRQKRSKRMTTSTLDSVPGLGEMRRKALLRHFGSVRRLKEATVEDIAEVPGIGRRTAQAILDALSGQPRPESLSGQPRPESLSGQPRPESLSGQPRPESGIDPARPDPASGHPSDGPQRVDSPNSGRSAQPVAEVS